LKINFKIIKKYFNIFFKKKKLKNQPPPTTSQLRRKSLPRNLSKNMHEIYSKGWPTLSPLGRDEGKPNIININQSKSCVGNEVFYQDKTRAINFKISDKKNFATSFLKIHNKKIYIFINLNK